MMRIVDRHMSIDELRGIASELFGNLVKAVVDVDRELLAIDAELHADIESLLLQRGSRLQDLWGINLYPDAPPEEFVEFDSMINVRPSQNNRTRSVESGDIRNRIVTVVRKWIVA